MRLALLSASLAYVAALGRPLNAPAPAPPGACVAPGTCTPPSTLYSRVIPGPQPGQQWNTEGGFCGAFSLQHSALAVGAYISQDLVRKANRDEPGEHHMHGDTTVGFEVMPSNIAYTAKALKLTFNEWDYLQPAPQAPAFKRWLKKQLVQGYAIAWFPICKGDSHTPYPGSAPNGGSTDHVEPMYGIWSNHPLDDDNVYPDDVIVHASDQDYQPYFRALDSLDDDLDMQGNCANAGAGFGKNEMYPCFYNKVTYGLAVTGLDVIGNRMPLYIQTDGAQFEPNVRNKEDPIPLTATITVTGTVADHQYELFRYNSTAALPSGPDFAIGYQSRQIFIASGPVWKHVDTVPFMSNSAVYYVAVALDF